MIESLAELVSPAAVPGERLCAETVGAWTSELSAAVAAATDEGPEGPGASGSGLDAAALVDAIRALEELSCVVTAAQAALSAELDTQTRAARAAAGVPAAAQGRGIGHQVAHARRVSPHRGARHLGLALIVQRELPHTWAAWRAGRITEWKATLIARETACLSLADRLAVDAQIAADPCWLEQRGDRELAGLVRAAAEQADPAAAVARRRNAEADRHASIRPAPDTMVWFTALLPVKAGVALWATLTRAADAARAAGDPRTRGQVITDTLVDTVTTHAATPTSTSWHDQPTSPSTDAGAPVGPGVQLGLVMTDAALFGTSEDPAHLEGYGPIPAELAREITADALTEGEKVWVRRLYTHPVTGELAAAETRSRRFRASLARFIRLRDRTCRTPWCDAPVRHLDHAADHASGGPTSTTNGQGMCEACNLAKQAPDWHTAPAPGEDHTHRIRTTLPTGHHYLTRPPPIGPTRTRPLQVDFILTG